MFLFRNTSLLCNWQSFWVCSLSLISALCDLLSTEQSLTLVIYFHTFTHFSFCLNNAENFCLWNSPFFIFPDLICRLFVFFYCFISIKFFFFVDIMLWRQVYSLSCRNKRKLHNVKEKLPTQQNFWSSITFIRIIRSWYFTLQQISLLHQERYLKS